MRFLGVLEADAGAGDAAISVSSGERARLRFLREVLRFLQSCIQIKHYEIMLKLYIEDLSVGLKCMHSRIFCYGTQNSFHVFSPSSRILIFTTQALVKKHPYSNIVDGARWRTSNFL